MGKFECVFYRVKNLKVWKICFRSKKQDEERNWIEYFLATISSSLSTRYNVFDFFGWRRSRVNHKITNRTQQSSSNPLLSSPHQASLQHQLYPLANPKQQTESSRLSSLIAIEHWIYLLLMLRLAHKTKQRHTEKTILPTERGEMKVNWMQHYAEINQKWCEEGDMGELCGEWKSRGGKKRNENWPEHKSKKERKSDERLRRLTSAYFCPATVVAAAIPLVSTQ